MPITFGSVGDIILVTLLVKDLATTLSNEGSPAEYQAAVRELGNLECVLVELKDLVCLCDRIGGYESLAQTAQLEAQKCKALIDPFCESTSNYGPSLRVGGSGNKAVDTYQKLHWKFSQKNRLDEFRRAISAQIDCMTALIAVPKM